MVVGAEETVLETGPRGGAGEKKVARTARGILRTEKHWFSTGRDVKIAIVLFNAILIGVLWAAVFERVRIERQNTVNAAIDRNNNIAIVFEQYTIRTVESADAVIQYLIREYVRNGRTMGLERLVGNFNIDNRAIIGVVLADARGEAKTTAYTGKSVRSLNVADREHFRVHIERDTGKVYVGKPVLGRVTGQWVIPVTRRINNADGTFGGVAMALIEPGRFTDVLHEATLRPLDVISLVGVDGITRARLSGTTPSQGEDIRKSPLFTEQAERPVGDYFARGQRDNVPRFFSYRTLADYSIIATVGTAEVDVMAEFYRRRTRYFWVAGLTSAGIAGFAVLLLLLLAGQRRSTANVARSQARFRATFNQAAVGIAHSNPDGRYLEVNQKLCDMLGYSREELLARTFRDVTHPDDVAAGLDLHRRLKARPVNVGTAPREERYIRRNGSTVWCLSAGSAVHDGDGNVEYVVAVIQDISDRKRAEIRIQHLNRVHAVLSGINALIVHVRDRDDLFKGACRIAVEAGAFSMAWVGVVNEESGTVKPIACAGNVGDFLESAPLAVIENKPGGHGLVGRAIREMKAMISNDVRNDPQRMMRKELEERGINSLAVIPLIVGDEAIGVLALYSMDVGFFDDEEMRLLDGLAANISYSIVHMEKQERLDYLAYYDALTGLANRTLFLERVAQYMRSAASSGHRLALILLDLERFKNINDSLGRPAGDALLCDVAEWLARNAGDASLLARLDADHFAAVLPKADQDGDVARLLEKLMAALLQHPFRLNDAVFRIAAKAGVALSPDDGADADTLFKNAEAALKEAKARGDRYLFYTQTMTETAAGTLTLENQLRQALDNEEFVLHYHPKVSLASGRLTGAEALIRWNDPRTGLVPPGRFIPVLEKTGLIHEAGRWALRRAIADYLRWRAAGLDAVRIAVNVSALQLRNRGFIEDIKQAIAIDPNATAGLELEITESLIMEDVKHNIATLQAIRALGVTIAIDDFGTGFSSLSYLAKLPVDTLKIDRSFVTDMTAGPQGLALVSTIIKLAHSLKLKVVAEGVETEEQSRLLRLLDCDEMQGFLFSKPVPSEIFETSFLAPASRQVAEIKSAFPR
jgi:diguanylate cyclase (GGDEF)-like protein/PAS domain S-box-containing protein